MANSNEKKSVNLLGAFKGLVVLLGIAFVVVCAAALFINFAGPGAAAFFTSLSSLDTAIIVALITGTISIVTFVIGSIVNNIMKRREYLRGHREKPYMQLISMYYDFSIRAAKGNELTEDRLTAQYNEFAKELVLWGSARAIQAWGTWRVSTSKGIEDPHELLFGMERVLIQLRKDLGLKRGVKKGDLLRLSVNDIDDYLGQESNIKH